MQKPVLGHIDCPACHAPHGMRFIHDKNGKPFGHCDDCNAQLRIGGNGYREKKFNSLYPWASGKAPEIPVTVTEQKPAEKPAPAAPQKPVTVTAPEPKETHHGPVKVRSAFEDALSILGGVKK